MVIAVMMIMMPDGGFNIRSVLMMRPGVYILLKNLVFYKELILGIEFFINNDE